MDSQFSNSNEDVLDDSDIDLTKFIKEAKRLLKKQK